MSYMIMKNVGPASPLPKKNEIKDFVDFEQAFDQIIERFINDGYLEGIPDRGFRLTAAGTLLALENRKLPKNMEHKQEPTKRPEKPD